MLKIVYTYKAQTRRGDAVEYLLYVGPLREEAE